MLSGPPRAHTARFNRVGTWHGLPTRVRQTGWPISGDGFMPAGGFVALRGCQRPYRGSWADRVGQLHMCT